MKTHIEIYTFIYFDVYIYKFICMAVNLYIDVYIYVYACR
jgi:hypothetical protein